MLTPWLCSVVAHGLKPGLNGPHDSAVELADSPPRQIQDLDFIY
jgi:hypothetical protein